MISWVFRKCFPLLNKTSFILSIRKFWKKIKPKWVVIKIILNVNKYKVKHPTELDKPRGWWSFRAEGKKPLLLFIIQKLLIGRMKFDNIYHFKIILR